MKRKSHPARSPIAGDDSCVARNIAMRGGAEVLRPLNMQECKAARMQNARPQGRKGARPQAVEE
jgi:hypothetical protein